MSRALAIAFVAAIATLEAACTPGTTVPPTLVNGGIDLGTCILDVISKDLLAKESLPQALQDAAVRCLGEATAGNVSKASDFWASHKAAEMREIDAGAK